MVFGTTYDKDLKQRVFMVRDSERYTNSTQTALEVTYLNNHKNYLTLKLNATVSHNLGDSSVAFYDNGELIGVVDCIENTTIEEFTINVPYGEHRLYAKYLGNTKCLSSKSGVYEVIVEEPNLPIPTLTVTRGDTHDWISRNTTLTLSVAFTGENNINNKSISLYDNDVLVETKTTNSSGVATFTSKKWSTKVHNLTFKFDGDDEYLANEVTDAFACGYFITAVADKVKVTPGQTVTFTVNVSVPDFDYTDGSDETIPTVYLTDSSTTHATKNILGTDTITSNAINSDKTLYVYVQYDSENKISFPISTIDVGGVRIDSSMPTHITTVGRVETISTRVLDTNSAYIQNAPVTLNINGTNYNGLTDRSGKFSVNYTGEGIGEFTAYAQCGNQQSPVRVFTDYVYYFDIKNSNTLRIDYYTRGSITHEVTTKGVQLATNSNESGSFTLNFTNPLLNNWEFRFDVISATNLTAITIGGYMFMYSELKNNPTITLRNEGRVLRVYYNDELKSTWEYDSTANEQFFAPYFLMSGIMVIDNIRLQRLTQFIGGD